MNRKDVEKKALQIASGIFTDGTMRTMLYERIVDAFSSRPVGDFGPRCPDCGSGMGAHRVAHYGAPVTCPSAKREHV